MGRGRRGVFNQSLRNTRSDLVLKKNQYFFAIAGDKKEVRPPFPPELIEALKKIEPKLFANAALDA